MEIERCVFQREKRNMNKSKDNDKLEKVARSEGPPRLLGDKKGTPYLNGDYLIG